MLIASNYESMVRSALLCPSGQNIKLIIRHSIRPHIDIVNGRHQDVSLTKEGIKLANELGSSLELTLGTLSSSRHLRCKQTCSEIINGYSIKNNVCAATFNINETEILQNSHVKDGKKTHDNFEKFGNEGLFKMYAEGENIDGQNSLRNSVVPMLNYIFLTRNKSTSIDIFCTHDFQMTQFLLYFWDCSREIQDRILQKWPRMLEGFFLWGEKNQFTVVWRGEKRRIFL